METYGLRARGTGAALCTLVGLGSACSWDSVVSSAGVPGTTLSAEISDLVERGSYLDARVHAGGFRYRLFFPNTPVCRDLLGRDAGLSYQWLGLGGRISDGYMRCDAVGVLSLRAWRDRQPRRSREPLPRAPASFRVEYSDPDLIQLRGRFPLASQLGFTGSGQLIAVVANEEPCQVFRHAGSASMEFRASGPVPLTLLAGNQLCPIVGLVQPPPGSTGRFPTAESEAAVRDFLEGVPVATFRGVENAFHGRIEVFSPLSRSQA